MSRKPIRESASSICRLLVIALALTSPSAVLAEDPFAAPSSLRGIPTQIIETPIGPLIKIEPVTTQPARTSARARADLSRRDATQDEGAGTAPSFTGDTFSFHHQIGALIDEIFECFSVHMSGMDDNTVTFDGMTEFLDPYLDGTQPFIFEFETSSRGTGVSNNFLNTFSNGPDLFPEGFEDPESGTPLDAACIEIGIDDTLDGDLPVDVTMAIIEASNDDGTVLPITDITSFFENPWDGRLSLVVPGLTGQGINGMVLELQIQQGTDPNAIFADGFETGDTTSWSQQVP